MQPEQKKIIDKVSACLGFEVQSTSVVATEIALANQFMPFFKRNHADESTWKNEQITDHVAFNDLHKITGRSGRPRFPNIKTLTTIINPDTQQIVKIASEWPEAARQIAPFPAADEEERQLLRKGEIFTSLPAATPPVDFFTALKQLDKKGPVPPSLAKQVMAYLVNHTTQRYGPKTVWIIQTRGIDLPAEGYAAYPGSVHPEARNHMRHIIDATTGQWLFSDTTPQPV